MREKNRANGWNWMGEDVGFRSCIVAMHFIPRRPSARG